MKRWVAGIAAVLVLGIIGLVSLNHKPTNTSEAWNEYRGKNFVGKYMVLIDETRKDGAWERLVHVEGQPGMFAKGAPRPVYMTGHDYDGDGRFDRIFISQTGEDGMNAVSFTSKGTRIWEPCLADKDTIKPFTDGQVEFAQGQLYLAMAQFHNDAHKVVRQ